MNKSKLQFCWLIIICICLTNIGYTQGIFLKFINVTCESKDVNFFLVDYCYIGKVDRSRNYLSLRYKIFRSIQKDFGFHFKFMIRSNGWRPFIYSVDIDVCRFWRSRYNALAKLLFGFIDGHTNLNHACPYSDKYLAIDKVINTDISKKVSGLPLSKGHYALFTKWSWKNVTRVETNIYIEVLND